MDSLNPVSLSSLTTPNETIHVRACASCSRAKAKCVPNHENSGKCHRCLRLQKTCEPSVPQIRTQPRKRRLKTTTHAPRTQVKKLEEKLDGLVSLIKSTQDIKSLHDSESSQRQLALPTSVMTSSNITTVPHPTAAVAAFMSQDQELPGTELTTQAALPFVRIRQSSSSSSSSSPTRSHGQNGFPKSISSNRFVPNFAEANTLLNIFRDQISPQFPFVVLPQSVSAEDLCLERPFLYVSILAITCRDFVQQLELGKLVMKQLAERMFVNGERSLDLLLGVITYAGWCYYNFWNTTNLISLLSASMTLICDLCLSRPLPNKLPNRNLFDDAHRDACAAHQASHMSKVVRKIEEQRAFLGCYFLNSVVSLFIRKIDQFQRYTPYVEDCLKDIDESEDHPNDKLAVELVRLQTILERIHQTSWHRKFEPNEVNASTLLIISSIREELRQFREKLPLELAVNPMILMHYHVAEISLYEVGLCKLPSATNALPNPKRLDLLCACLEANKSYFEIFFSIPVASYIAISMPSWLQLTYCLTNLFMLATFDHPVWNIACVREAVDIKIVLSQLIDQFERVDKVPGYEKIEMFPRFTKKMNRIKVYVEGKLADPLRGVVELESTQEPNPSLATGTEDLSDFFQFLDDTWMGDIIDSSDVQFNTTVES